MAEQRALRNESPSSDDLAQRIRGLMEIGCFSAARSLVRDAEPPSGMLSRLELICGFALGDTEAAAQMQKLCATDPEADADMGLLHQMTGRMEAAAQCFRSVLGHKPGHPLAATRLASLLMGNGERDQAEALLLEALARHPESPDLESAMVRLLSISGRGEAAKQLILALAGRRPFSPLAQVDAAEALMAAGKPLDALKLVHRAAELAPDWPRALHLLSRLEQATGNLEQAARVARRLASLQPQDAEALARLAHAEHGVGNRSAAQEVAGRSIAIEDNAAARLLLSSMALDDGSPELALYHADAALKFGPSPAANNNRGLALLRLHRLDDAEKDARAAVVALPRWSIPYISLAAILRAQGRIAEALQAAEAALRLNPTYQEAWIAAAALLSRLDRIKDAIGACHRALSIGDRAEAEWNMALALLKAGRFEEGWTRFESRGRLTLAPLAGTRPNLPEWRGGPVQMLRVVAEQGLGDTIQFLRFMPLLKDRVAQLQLVVQDPLKEIAKRALPRILVVGPEDSLPTAEAWIRLMSLPLLLGINSETQLRPSSPSIVARPDLVRKWEKERVEGPGLQIGLCWRGNPLHEDDCRRSIPLQALAPLTNTGEHVFYSLQTEIREDEDVAAPSIIDRHRDLTSYDETAAMMATLDLIITCDTSVAHLAGAMGRPVWLLLPTGADWRWLMARDDTPWYPTMRLFRQAAAGDWAGVISRVAEALAAMPAPSRSNI